MVRSLQNEYIKNRGYAIARGRKRKSSRREKAFINPAGGKAVSGETGFNSI